MKYGKRFLIFFATLALAFAMVPAAGFAAYAEDDVQGEPTPDAVTGGGDQPAVGDAEADDAPADDTVTPSDGSNGSASTPSAGAPAAAPAQTSATSPAPTQTELAVAETTVTSISLTATSPVCGTHVTVTTTSDDLEYNPAPDVTVSSTGCEIYTAWWIEGTTLDDLEPIRNDFDIDGNKSYQCLLMIVPQEEYVIDPYATVTISGGTVLETSPMIAGLFVLVEIPAVHKAGSPTESNVVKPTCTEPGSHVETVACSACGAIISEQTVTDPATGHNWGEWTVKKNPTATEDGELIRVCKNDSTHVETRPIPATGKNNTPKTGDETNFALPAAFATTGILVLGAAFVLRRKLEQE